eukprot:TRINITY_DN36754_c0_g1_i2.p1 TRINITY_DN36754_c0_g1~~TRINITY_DN36754_c0_g1_i2.p1  ORF type:complete len:113 (+),score=32.30 TRINITY_DN36754_c0_g1_i2:126-464(+)
MIRRPPRSTLSSSSAASDVYKRQLPAWVHPCELGNVVHVVVDGDPGVAGLVVLGELSLGDLGGGGLDHERHSSHRDDPVLLSLIHISEPTRLLSISYAVFCLKKKKHNKQNA